MFKFWNYFRPALHIARLPQKEIQALYRKYRRHVFIGVTIGYSSFYLVRNNFTFAVPHLIQQGFSKTQLGLIFSCLPLAYGCSKFFMSAVSDRSHPRYFMLTGLVLSIIINFFYGTNLVLNNFSLMVLLMFLNGWAQSMGYPSLVRVMVHWFSGPERRTKMVAVGVIQNIGEGVIGPLTILGVSIFGSWHSIFYFPAMLATVSIIIILLLVKDTPQSEGLPAIEKYKKIQDNTQDNIQDNIQNNIGVEADCERELTVKEILFNHVLVNKYLWHLAFANMFVYFLRYGIINWAPTYLQEMKGFTSNASGWSYLLYVYAAIPGMVLCTWISDKFFHGRRTQCSIIYIAMTMFAIIFYWFIPLNNPLYINIALAMMGFFIYGPVMLIGLHAIEMAPKKVAGTAVGLTGFLGSIGGVLANIGIGWIVDHFGWNIGFIIFLSACVLAILCLSLNVRWEKSKLIKS